MIESLDMKEVLFLFAHLYQIAQATLKCTMHFQIPNDFLHLTCYMYYHAQ